MSTPVAPHQPYPAQTPPPPKKSGGSSCLILGCLGCMGLIILAIVGVGAGMYYGMVVPLKEYTSETPMEIPQYVLAAGEYEDVKARMEAFKASFDSGQPAELSLTDDDLNAFIAGDPDMKGMRGNMNFRITEDDALVTDASIPMDDIPLFNVFLEGRYLNGTLGLTVELPTPGFLVVRASEIVVDGKPIPAEIMDALGRENLAQDVHRNPEIGPIIQQLDSVRIEDGRLILKKE